MNAPDRPDVPAGAWVVATVLTGQPAWRHEPYPCLCAVWAPDRAEVGIYQARRRITGRCDRRCPCQGQLDRPPRCCGYRSRVVTDADFEGAFARDRR